MFKRKKYKNLDGIAHDKTFKDMMRWRKERKQKTKNLADIISHTDLKEVDFLKTNLNESTITWIGHSSFLIQINGINILTDPVFAKRMGFQPRLTAPGIDLNELPPIQVVVISHGHYDHLDFPSLRGLKGDPFFLVPMGLKRLFNKKGFYHTEEFNWWDTFSYKALEFIFVPARHWTRRGLFDMNTSHWGGWVIKGFDNIKTIYFVGDTGYFDGFKEIGSKYEINYVLMPIGAYEPEWFMEVSHINPEDAVNAFLELGAAHFIPMHYGTFHLADDTGPEALLRLEKAWIDNRLDSKRLSILKLGETLRTKLKAT